MKGGLSQIMEDKLSSSSSTASTTLSIKGCRNVIRMAAQFFPIDNQYLAPICDKEILVYPFLIQRSLMKDITCRVVERILDKRLESDQKELELQEELAKQAGLGLPSFLEELYDAVLNETDGGARSDEQQTFISEAMNQFSNISEEVGLTQEIMISKLIEYLSNGLTQFRSDQGLSKEMKNIYQMLPSVEIGLNEVKLTQNMIDQYNCDIERQKKVLCSWQKGNFSQYAEEIKVRVFKYKKGVIFQQEVEKELARYIILLSDKNVQDIFKRFEDILHISKGNSQQLKMLLHIHPELVIIHVLNINMANIINKVVDKSIKVSRELEEDIDHSTQNLSREHSMSFKILSSISMIIAPLPVLYYIFTHTSALAITHIYNTYANYQYGGPIRKKVQDIAAELDINYKSYLKKSIEENPSNKLGKPGVQEIANNNQKL